MPVAKKQDQRIITDGCAFPPDWNPLEIQLWLFRYAPQLQLDPFWRPGGKRSDRAYSGSGRFAHCKTVIDLLMPSFEWHEWSEQQVRALCAHSQIAMCGGGGSGKSCSTGAYALVFAMSGLNYKSESEGGDTGVLIASTTIDAAIRRIWKSVAQFYGDMMRASGGGVGRQTMFGKPRPQIRAAPKDLMHGLFVIPVATGDIQKAINDLKGFHPKRLLLIGDETDSISQAVVEVQDNLRVGTEEFQAVWLGNLPSIFNPLGKLMEPAPNTPVSEECGLEWTSTSGVHCLRFDGELSPNITGEEKWSGLPRQRDLDATLRRNQGIKGQQYYIMVRGLPPPDGVDDTVLSESTLNRFHVRDPVTWAGQFITSAALDPGFGGDPCCLKVFRRGSDTGGKLRAALLETILIPVSAADPTNPAEFQIAKRVQEICVSRSIAPDEFVLDSTGIGRGTAAVLQREWSANIQTCNFGGAASERPVSNEDPRPASEAYDRQVTELWFSIREFIHADILRALDLDTARQLTQRRFEVKNRKFSVEKKEDMKGRGIPSPNDADALACYIHLLRSKGIYAAPSGPATITASHEWEEAAAQWSIEGASADYATFG